MRSCWLAFAVAVAGCVGSPGVAVDGGGGGALDGAGTADGGGGPFAGPITLPFSAEIHWADGVGMANGPVEAANFSANVGTIVYNGRTLPALVYREIPFGQYDLAAIVATTDDNILVLYAYCQGGGVVGWYHEALDEPVTYQAPRTAGTCALPHDPVTSDVKFLPFAGPPPGLLAAVAQDPLRQRATTATVSGPKINIAQGQGSAQFASEQWQILTFDWVDCGTICGTPGWYELHSLLQRGPAVSFGIFYLISDQPTSVRFEYPIRFDVPSVAPVETSFSATWSAP